MSESITKSERQELLNRVCKLCDKRVNSTIKRYIMCEDHRYLTTEDRKELRIKIGICAKCWNPAVQGKTLCGNCNDLQNLRARNKRPESLRNKQKIIEEKEKQLLNRICNICDKPVNSIRERYVTCEEHRYLSLHERRVLRAKLGMCGKCKNSAVEGKTLCAECNDLQNLNDRNRRGKLSRDNQLQTTSHEEQVTREEKHKSLSVTRVYSCSARSQYVDHPEITEKLELLERWCIGLATISSSHGVTPNPPDIFGNDPRYGE